MLSAANADGISNKHLAKAHRLAYERIARDGGSAVRVYNIDGGGFVLTHGNDVVGYSDEGMFSPSTAAPAMMAMLEQLENAPSVSAEANANVASDASFHATAVAPLLGEIAWNQDSPYNDLCPKYDLMNTCPTGCVATAMAQVMYYHRWPLVGIGSHSYEPAILLGASLSADFGSTQYRWDAMLPNYIDAYVSQNASDQYSIEERRDAVAELMLHCGVSVDMVYYSSSGADNIAVPPALICYFNYDRGLALRNRTNYATADWLSIINGELSEGRPVLAYGRSASGGHAYVFDGMDEDGLIHVNWGWGGMSNGYFRTSALTPAAQGIGGSDGGFNYKQSIITGIRPADEAASSDYHVELVSTEGLTPAKKKIANGGEVVIKLSGKVSNRGWRDSEFDYALMLLDAEGDTVRIIDGPQGAHLALEATDYAPTFGTVSLGTLAEGSYMLYPVCRMTGGKGSWQRIRDQYIGYPNSLIVKATASDIQFSTTDYFSLKATETVVPEVIYNGVPTLITTNITNNGDVEYHGEVKATLRNAQTNSIVATTSNYIIDLLPGETTQLKFTDSFQAAAGSYYVVLNDDDGAAISSRYNVTVTAAPAMATVLSASPLTVVTALPDQMEVKARVKVDNGFFGGLLYTFIMSADGKRELGCLFPEYISLTADGTEAEVTMRGTFENGVPGYTYVAHLATYSGTYSFLSDADSSVEFIFNETAGVESVEADAATTVKYYDFQGREVKPWQRQGKALKRVVKKSK